VTKKTRKPRKPAKKTTRRKTAKPARKAARARGPGKPFEPGYDPRRNVTKPGPGRPPDKFKIPLGEYTDKQVEKIGKYLNSHGPNDPDWWKCLEFAARYSKRRAELEDDTGERLPYVVIAPGPPAGIVKEENDNGK
jgi:hypothetical protein